VLGVLSGALASLTATGQQPEEHREPVVTGSLCSPSLPLRSSAVPRVAPPFTLGRHSCEAQVECHPGQLGHPPNGTTIDLHIALKPHCENALIDAVCYEVSRPRYRNHVIFATLFEAYSSLLRCAASFHLSKEEVVAPHPQSLERVSSWLEYNGVPPSSISRWLTVPVPGRRTPRSIIPPPQPCPDERDNSPNGWLCTPCGAAHTRSNHCTDNGLRVHVASAADATQPLWWKGGVGRTRGCVAAPLAGSVRQTFVSALAVHTINYTPAATCSGLRASTINTRVKRI
jgi:hypothetical protein